MDRHIVLEIAIKKHNPQKYMEIGLDDAKHFASVPVRHKIGIDPVKPAIMDSLVNDNVQFFQMDSVKFLCEYPDLVSDVDMVFIDGLHEYHQVYNEVMLLMQLLKVGGRIFLHDCNPIAAYISRSFFTMSPAEYKNPGPWSGDVWKAILLLRQLYPEWGIKVLDIDGGIGFIKKEREFDQRVVPDSLWEKIDKLKYDDLRSHRYEYLNLRPISGKPLSQKKKQ
ncbi:hypothetical protein AGMMS49992_21660 [Clostridia bacterium]|nr:hypothetical protein AGMMS49992_21660 [Clostridia bacterium]